MAKAPFQLRYYPTINRGVNSCSEGMHSVKYALLGGAIIKHSFLIARFDGDPEGYKYLFKIGSDIPKLVKSLIPLYSYMIEQVQEKKEVLLKNGLKQSKIDELIAAPAELKAADDVQENAKKIQMSRTLERDAAAKELKEQVFKIRNFVKACFSGKPEILVQFNPIPKGRSGDNGEEPTPLAKGEFKYER